MAKRQRKDIVTNSKYVKKNSRRVTNTRGKPGKPGHLFGKNPDERACPTLTNQDDWFAYCMLPSAPRWGNWSDWGWKERWKCCGMLQQQNRRR